MRTVHLTGRAVEGFDAVPDADVLGQCVLESLEELKDSASDSRPRAPRGRRKTSEAGKT